MKLLKIVIVSLLLLVNSNVFVQANNQEIRKDYVEGEVLVKFKKNRVNLQGGIGVHTMQVVENAVAGEVIRRFDDLNLIAIRSENLTTAELIAELSENPNVEYVEPNMKVRLMNADPTDAHFALQWYLKNTGQNDGLPEADIDAVRAFAMYESFNLTDVVVAVIDSGVRYTHEDLVGIFWNGVNCVDHNNVAVEGGCTNFGYSYIDGENFNNTLDSQRHGTNVTGIIGANKNQIGVTGIADNVDIMIVKAFEADGTADLLDVIAGINFARFNGARVINASFGVAGCGFPGEFAAICQGLYDAVEAFIINNNGLVVASSGNYGANNEVYAEQVIQGVNTVVSPIYPASFDLAGVIAVGSSTRHEELSSFSNYGVTTVDLVAPGSTIMTTDADTDNDYSSPNGTSFSAPMVTAAAAVMFGTNANLTPAQVKGFILDGVDTFQAYDNTVTGGRLNLYKTVLNALDVQVGFAAEGVIPAAQITQVDDGSGHVTVNFRVTSSQVGLPFRISEFRYNVLADEDVGYIIQFVDPGNDDFIFQENYVTQANFAAEEFYSFTFLAKDPAFTDLNNVNGGEIQIQLRVEVDGVLESELAESEVFTLDVVGPTFGGVLASVENPVKTHTFQISSASADLASYRHKIHNVQEALNAIDWTGVAVVPIAPDAVVGVTLDDQGYDDDTYYVTVQLFDDMNNISERQVSVTLDNTPPVLQLANDAVPTNSKTFALNAEDASNVEYRWTVLNEDVFNFDDEPYEAIDEVTIDADFLLNDGLLEDGLLYLHIQAQDVLENTANPIMASFILDVTPPLAVRLSSVEDSTSKSATVNVLQPEGEGLEEVTHYRYRLNNGAWSAEFAVNTAISLNNLAVGVQTLRVEGRDAVGNYQLEPTVINWTVSQAQNAGGGGGGGGGGEAVVSLNNAGSEDVAARVERFENTLVVPMFSDLSDHWAVKFVNFLYNEGVVKGKGEGQFAPDDKITRAEMLKIALEIFNYDLNAVAGVGFQDVATTDWFYSYVMVAQQKGVISGYSDGTFRPNTQISRAEALKILLVASKLDLTDKGVAPFVDVPRNEWFTGFVDYAYSKAVVSGKTPSEFAPANFVTRAELSKMAVLTSLIGG